MSETQVITYFFSIGFFLVLFALSWCLGHKPATRWFFVAILILLLLGLLGVFG
jgi:hypothetical protein